MNPHLYTVSIFFTTIENKESICRRTTNAFSEREALHRVLLHLQKTNRSFVLHNMKGWTISKGSDFHVLPQHEGTLMDALL